MVIVLSWSGKKSPVLRTRYELFLLRVRSRLRQLTRNPLSLEATSSKGVLAIFSLASSKLESIK